jgi:gamma-glutamyltranspeptidase/glutathione hydrolase
MLIFVLGACVLGSMVQSQVVAAEAVEAGETADADKAEEAEEEPVRAGYHRGSGVANQSRSVVLAAHGIVATSQPLAAQVGLEILKRGGTAADAAIATSAMMGVVEPMSCGIGGDIFVIYWDAKSQKLYGLNGSGRSPYALTRAVFAEKEMDQIPEKGPLSWSVPGCVAGWGDLYERFGSLPFADLLAPAIEHAEDGFPVTEIIAGYWRGAEKDLKEYSDSAATLLIDGRAPREGEVFKNARLAGTLRAIADGGAEAFYGGRNAKEIVHFSEANGGYFSLKDFADHRSEWVEPVSTTYRGYTVWELPPNGQGIAALQMLNLIEPFDIAAMGPGSADWFHLFVEAKKLAFADRARFYADPAGQELPVAELISKEYAKRRGERIDMANSATDVPHGDARLAAGDTIYLTVVDKDRNCCSLIQSNYFGFGSKVVPGDVGYVLQNRGALFALDDEHPNRLEPHKRPFHTIIPAMVTKAVDEDGADVPDSSFNPEPTATAQKGTGTNSPSAVQVASGSDARIGASPKERPIFCFGVMGGDMQPQGHVQILVNILDFGMNVQQAGDVSRVRHEGSATPTGIAAKEGGTVSVESSVPQEVIDELTRRGHTVEVAKSGDGLGGYQGIWIDWESGVLHGATEPRKDGVAVGY